MILPQTWSDCVEQQHDYQLFRLEAPLPSSLCFGGSQNGEIHSGVCIESKDEHLGFFQCQAGSFRKDDPH